MSADTQAAAAEFEIAMQDSRNLVAIHKERNTEPGRRWLEPSINRAIVVMTVAGWQAYLVDFTKAILEDIKPPGGHPRLVDYQMIRADTRTALGRFNTPDVRNTRNLLARVGFDPQPYWTWRFARWSFTPDVAVTRIDEWLRVRHTIAHGSPLPIVGVIGRKANGDPTLTRGNAEDCMKFFQRLVNLTTEGAGAEFP